MNLTTIEEIKGFIILITDIKCWDSLAFSLL